MTQLSDEVVEKVARALMRTSGMHPSEIEHRISKNTGGWAAWQQSAIVALEASGHAELVEALEWTNGLLKEYGSKSVRADVVLAKAKGEAPPNVG